MSVLISGMCTLDASGFQKSQESTVLGGRDRRGPTGRTLALPVLPRRPKVYRRNCPVSYFFVSRGHTSVHYERGSPTPPMGGMPPGPIVALCSLIPDP